MCRKCQRNSSSISANRIKNNKLRAENIRELFLRGSSAPVHSGREMKFGRERDEFCVKR